MVVAAERVAAFSFVRRPSHPALVFGSLKLCPLWVISGHICSHWQELFQIERKIDSRLAAAVAGRIHSDTRYIDRAFIILSYEPNADELIFPDRCPIFELEIKQSNAA